MNALIAMSLVGCKDPPQAPTELNELAGFVFERFLDEDTDELALGVDNLDTWVHSNIDATLDGYTVDNLEQSVIDSVDPDREHDLSNLGGASVAYISAFPVTPIARTLVLKEQEKVFPKSYDSHDREFLTETACFMPHDCDLVDTDNLVEASYGGAINIKVSTHSRAQFRWLRYGDPEQWALLHRTWLLEPAAVSMDGVAVREQLYVGVTMMWEQGTAVRVGTTWVAAGLPLGFDETLALNMMIDAMSGEGENLDAFLEAEQ
jgi:hypothetical protein